MLVCIPDVLEWTELKKIRATIADATFVDGGRTAGYRARRVKNNEQMDKDSKAASEIKAMIAAALRRNATLQRAALPQSIRPILISRYREGMAYGFHVDNPLMGKKPRTRVDLAVTVFLSDPADYDGGELIMASPFGDQEVKLPAGAAVLYPANTLHKVAPITRGERLAGVTWIKSHVRDMGQREMLYDLYRIRESLTKIDPDGEDTGLAAKTYANLMRMWAD